MLLKILLLVILTFSLSAKDILQKNYYVDTDYIHLSTITKNPKDNFLLFKLDRNRYTKRVKSKELINLLQKHGYNSFSSKNRYVKFIKKSPINLSKIKNEIKKLYKNRYATIDIKNISVIPRGYIHALPKEYQVNFSSRSYLSNHGTLYIKTPQRKKIFFNYSIDADITIIIAKKNIQKTTQLSPINTTKKTILLDRFRAIPLQNTQNKKIEAKHRIKRDSIITTRDIKTLDIVKKDSNVNVTLSQGEISITFSAKALQDGKLNDINTIQKRNRKRLKARVVGKNRVEIR
jgi:flagella basal body P-ring formation protein FlgA